MKTERLRSGGATRSIVRGSSQPAHLRPQTRDTILKRLSHSRELRNMQQYHIPALFIVHPALENSVRAISGAPAPASVPNLKFAGLQIDSIMADSPDFGEDW